MHSRGPRARLQLQPDSLSPVLSQGAQASPGRGRGGWSAVLCLSHCGHLCSLQLVQCAQSRFHFHPAVGCGGRWEVMTHPQAPRQHPIVLVRARAQGFGPAPEAASGTPKLGGLIPLWPESGNLCPCSLGIGLGLQTGKGALGSSLPSACPGAGWGDTQPLPLPPGRCHGH